MTDPSSLTTAEIEHSASDLPTDPCLVGTTEPENTAGEGLTVSLMEHQEQGLYWMKSMERSNKKGGILADDMGLGKTIQALALIAARPAPAGERHATLIITPAGLVKQWKHEIMRMLDQRRHPRPLYVVHGGKARVDFSLLNEHDIVLTTFGTVAAELRRKDHRLILSSASKWHRVILDEAQHIKGPKTRAAIACRAIDATYRWCLTGTPVMNHLNEFDSLLKFLRVETYSNKNRQVSQVRVDGEGRYQDREITHLQEEVKSIMLRRTKTSVVHGRPILVLPARITENVYVTFNTEERQLYTALESRSQFQFSRYLSRETTTLTVSHILGLLHRLRQACCHPWLISGSPLSVRDLSQSQGHLVANAHRFSEAVATRLLRYEDIRECPICINMVENPVILFPCGHNVCSDCFATITRSTHREMHCPYCRTIIAPAEATDYVSFQEAHYLMHTSSKSSDDTWRSLGNLQDWTAEGTDDDINHSRRSLLDQIPGITSTIDPWSRYGISSDLTKASNKRTFAQLRRLALAKPTTRDAYQRALEGSWISSSKVDKALEIIQVVRAQSETEKVLVFSQFTSLLDLVEVPLRRQGWHYHRYDGDLTPSERHTAVMKFATDPNCRILLISLKAGNSGLNLTAASRVIILDPFWNPFIEEQAVGRVHRIGQQRPVHVYRILVPGTVEDRILEFQNRKRELFQGILAEDIGVKCGPLEREDLAYLFVSQYYFYFLI
ncbi:hypothetical protein RU639_013591 [Aspergillus parasiticus]